MQGSRQNKTVWSVLLAARPAGGPYTLTMKASGTSLTLKDVLFGDVWLCSGQSNMEFSIPGVCSYLRYCDVVMVKSMKIGGHTELQC